MRYTYFIIYNIKWKFFISRNINENFENENSCCIELAFNYFLERNARYFRSWLWNNVLDDSFITFRIDLPEKEKQIQILFKMKTSNSFIKK